MKSEQLHISRDCFLRAFLDEWRAVLSRDWDIVWGAYKETRTWTEFMMPYGAFFDRTCKRLSLTYYKELYSIDAAFVGGEDLFRSDLAYPSQVHVLLEHENGPNVEEEMWKLLHWRCPLKVLVFYDYPEKSTSAPSLSGWGAQKLKALEEMRQKVVDFLPEHEAVTYLYIIGQTTSNESIRWWSATDNSSQPEPLERI